MIHLRLPRPARYTLEVILTALIYFAAARASLLLSFGNTNASPVWPPSGIALAAVLLAGYRVVPGIFVGALLANFTTLFSNGSGDLTVILLVSLGIAAGNTLEALTGALLLRGLQPAWSRLDGLRSVVTFSAVAPVMCLVSALIGTTALHLARIAPADLIWKVSLTWWLGDTVGVLMVAPFLVTWESALEARKNISHLVEGVFLIALLVGTGWVAFGGWSAARNAGLPLEFTFVPFLVWAAIRFQARGAATAVVATSGIAIW